MSDSGLEARITELEIQVGRQDERLKAHDYRITLMGRTVLSILLGAAAMILYAGKAI